MCLLLQHLITKNNFAIFTLFQVLHLTQDLVEYLHQFLTQQSWLGLTIQSAASEWPSRIPALCAVFTKVKRQHTPAPKDKEPASDAYFQRVQVFSSPKTPRSFFSIAQLLRAASRWTAGLFLLPLPLLIQATLILQGKIHHILPPNELPPFKKRDDVVLLTSQKYLFSSFERFMWLFYVSSFRIVIRQNFRWVHHCTELTWGQLNSVERNSRYYYILRAACFGSKVKVESLLLFCLTIVNSPRTSIYLWNWLPLKSFCPYFCNNNYYLGLSTLFPLLLE